MNLNTPHHLEGTTVSDGQKFEYTMEARTADANFEITSFVNGKIADMAKDGWEIHQINPSVIGVTDSYNGGVRPQYDVMLTFRRPVQVHPMEEVVGKIRP